MARNSGSIWEGVGIRSAATSGGDGECRGEGAGGGGGARGGFDDPGAGAGKGRVLLGWGGEMGVCVVLRGGFGGLTWEWEWDWDSEVL